MGHLKNGPYDEICCPVYEYWYYYYWSVDPNIFDCNSYSAISHLFYGYWAYYWWIPGQGTCDWRYCVYGAIGLSTYGCYLSEWGWIVYALGWWRVFGMSQDNGVFPPYPTEGGVVEKIADDYAMTPQTGVVFEPDYHEGAELATLMLANKNDKTNVLIQYDPLLMIAVPYIITGTLTPAAAGNYTCESGYKDRPTYVGPLRAFFIWWDGINSWYISTCVGDASGPCWKRTALCLIGDYNPYAGATGIATIAAGPR
jgi:hypothetical protein